MLWKVQSSALCVLQVNILLWVLRLKLNALHVQLGNFPERVLRCAQIVARILIPIDRQLQSVLRVICTVWHLPVLAYAHDDQLSFRIRQQSCQILLRPLDLCLCL